MIVHRVLDVVFRTLDTVDAVRAKVGAVLGKVDAQPPSQWAPTVEPPPPAPALDKQDAVKAVYAPPSLEVYEAPKDEADEGKVAAKAKKQAPSATAKKAAEKEPAKKAKASPVAAKPKRATKAEKASKPPVAASRKGSVDRSGKDFDSPRARAIATWLKDNGAAVVTEDAAVDGKRTVARVLWAVAAAESAGSEQGLTAADTSALLSMATGLEVFATNVARAFRDESDLFVETSPDGRSKRYTLTAAGRARVAEIETVKA